jgi:DNA polymerase-4
VDRTILHIDMDAFFAAIEVRDDPELEGKPVIVGGSMNRGVVSTANYEARRFGVHSAMPLFRAKQRCPQGIFLPVRMPRYKEVSRQVMDILHNFTPLVEEVSIDEAYLDVSGTEDLLGSPELIARHIKERIHREIQLTCSIGIAPNKFLAKVASDMHKPDGLTIIRANEADAFLSGLPVDKIPGVGKTTLDALKRDGIETAGDLKKSSKEQLVRKFGKFGLRLYELAQGHDSSPVEPLREVKSIGAECTLPSDTGDLSVLSSTLRTHAHSVARRLRKQGLKAKTITIKIKFSDFSSVSKNHTFAEATDSSKMISDIAIQLLRNQPLQNKVRLIGVAASNLAEISVDAQMKLFPGVPSKQRERKVDKVMDEIREKYGGKVIQRGAE